MIEYIEGNIFDSPAQVIVNTVNTVGVMGKGIALSFKQRYPDMFERYKIACEKKQLTIGKLMLFYEADHWLLLFPTKENWRHPSKLEYIEKGLMKFANTYADKNITSIAFPKLGCGNGGLDWNDVKPLMEKYLKPLPIDVYVYIGELKDETPEHKKQSEITEWLKSNAKDLSFNGLKDEIEMICSGLLPYKLTLNDVECEVAYNKGIKFIMSDGQDEFEISEEEMFETWDNIRNVSVFASPSDFNAISLFYEMLCELRYLTKIKILDSKNNEMISGYQINEGADRVFLIGERV